jgi:hypothetical protein
MMVAVETTSLEDAYLKIAQLDNRYADIQAEEDPLLDDK